MSADRNQQEPVAVRYMMRWVEHLKRRSDGRRHMNIPSGFSSGDCWELAIELEQFVKSTSPQRKPLSDEEIWKFWWARTEVPEGEDDSMEAQFVAAVRAIEAGYGIKE